MFTVDLQMFIHFIYLTCIGGLMSSANVKSNCNIFSVLREFIQLREQSTLKRTMVEAGGGGRRSLERTVKT